MRAALVHSGFLLLLPIDTSASALTNVLRGRSAALRFANIAALIVFPIRSARGGPSFSLKEVRR